ncbi:unnamed protein product [Gadus morhua 'NCC']
MSGDGVKVLKERRPPGAHRPGGGPGWVHDTVRVALVSHPQATLLPPTKTLPQPPATKHRLPINGLGGCVSTPDKTPGGEFISI